MTTFNRYPEILVSKANKRAIQGYEAIQNEISKVIKSGGKDKTIVMIDCYPGVKLMEIEEQLISKMQADCIMVSDELMYSNERITEMIKKNLTDDRVFGVLCPNNFNEFYDANLLEKARNKIIEMKSGLVIIYGVGARLVCEPDFLIYADLTRWEIQKRYNAQMPNWKASNPDEDYVRKLKRGYFFEWPLADKYKKKLFDEIDFLLDTNSENDPKMVDGKNYLLGMKQATSQPFSVVPYFAPGVWGGQWMKEKLKLDPTGKNYAWSFNGVPSENSICLRYDDVKIEIPAINLVFQHPVELLGDKVHARFGTEFPIRFNFLDTFDGQNLSLQIHPLNEYVQENFGVHYTQDESYYILDAKENAVVYMGLNDNVDKNEMMEDLVRSNEGLCKFDDEKYINQFTIKKHDHYLIPAGTIHSSGKNSVVLEISSTPNIFTFKLWDWGRLGLDGLPRPVHLEHGKNSIQWNRDKQWVKENLINRIEKKGEGKGWIEEKTGLHERQFIETRRHWFSEKVYHQTNESVNVLNLVDGDEAIIESFNDEFEPFIIHYAETVIIPESIKEYTIKPHGKSEGKTIATIKAFVRV